MVLTCLSTAPCEFNGREGRGHEMHVSSLTLLRLMTREERRDEQHLDLFYVRRKSRERE